MPAEPHMPVNGRLMQDREQDQATRTDLVGARLEETHSWETLCAERGD
jgi:hypothetical protein